jgi:hypothetical protein
MAGQPGNTSKSSAEKRYLAVAIESAYSARARLFHETLAASDMRKLFREIDGLKNKSLNWVPGEMGISDAAFDRAKALNIPPYEVFANPQVIQDNPKLIAYYRNMAAISQKGVAQILFGVTGYEKGKSTKLDDGRAVQIASLFNRIMSKILEGLPKYSRHVTKDAVFAEIGTELQGTWANMVGTGAAKAVERVISDYLDQHHLLASQSKRTYTLTNGWTIVYASEPDVAFYDSRKSLQIAIEIKGSLDKAGAQTRYGETKKSFAKAMALNPRCHTVYLASCFTPSVTKQIQSDSTVRECFCLTDVLADTKERTRFLDHIFHVVHTPQ